MTKPRHRKRQATTMDKNNNKEKADAEGKVEVEGEIETEITEESASEATPKDDEQDYVESESENTEDEDMEEDGEKTDEDGGKEKGTTHEDMDLDRMAAKLLDDSTDQLTQETDQADSAASNQEEEKTTINPENIRKLRDRGGITKDYAEMHSGRRTPTPQETTQTKEKKGKRKRTANKPTEATATKHLEKKIEKMTSEVTRLEKKVEKMEKERKEDRQEIQETKKENSELKKEMQEKDTEILELNQDLDQMRKQKEKAETEVNSKDNEITVQQKRVKALEETVKTLRKELRDIKDNKPPEETPPTLTMVGDSNARRIQEQMERNMNRKTPYVEALTLDDALAWAEDVDPRTCKGTTFILQVGTNDIRHGKHTAHTAGQVYKAITEKLTKKNIKYRVSQIPPLYCENGTEGVKLNAKLEDRHYDIISTEDIEQDRWKMGKDGYHLTDKSSYHMARKILQQTGHTKSDLREIKVSDTGMEVTVHGNEPQGTKAPTEPQTAKKKDSIVTTRNKAALVIGKQGKRINNLKINFQVEIDTMNNGDDRTFIITGEEEDVKNAKKEIEHIINNDHRDENKRPQICRFYRSGRCRHGQNCRYLHTEGPTDISMRTASTDSSYSSSDQDEPSPKYHRRMETPQEQQPIRRTRSPSRSRTKNHSNTTKSRHHSPDNRSRRERQTHRRNRTPTSRSSRDHRTDKEREENKGDRHKENKEQERPSQTHRRRSPSENRKRRGSPTEDRRRRSPLEDRSRRSSPSADRRRRRSPPEERSRRSSPSANRRRRTSPSQDKRRRNSPVADRRRRSPQEDRRRRRSPSEDSLDNLISLIAEKAKKRKK